MEFGGFRDPLMLKNKEGKLTQIYQIGYLVKEYRNCAPSLVVFFCGDFMDKNIKKNQILMKWACAAVDIELDKLFSISPSGPDGNPQKLMPYHIHQMQSLQKSKRRAITLTIVK